MERNFTRQARDQLWVTDITERPTFEGKVYCAVVLDAFSRRVVGWSTDASRTAALTTNALAMATAPRGRVAPSSTPITECSASPGRSPSALGPPACCPRNELRTSPVARNQATRPHPTRDSPEPPPIPERFS
ncbi:DDE-type integrase/transposase/recombinase [Streptomyces mirabilis]|uniref:DDE-type integrase/transposase/recombinase n=1 Tax=Streptomyces mirabilis TaxID=68239 RepID=UPI00371C75D7